MSHSAWPVHPWVWGSVMQACVLALKVSLESLNPGKPNSSTPTTKICLACGQAKLIAEQETRAGAEWLADTQAWVAAREEKLKQLFNLYWMGFCLQKNLKKNLCKEKSVLNQKKIIESVLWLLFFFSVSFLRPARTACFILTVFCLLNWKIVLKKLLAD